MRVGLDIIEVQPYPRNYVVKHLLENNKVQIQNEAEAHHYYDLFDGNMLDLMQFTKDNFSLQGINKILKFN